MLQMKRWQGARCAYLGMHSDLTMAALFRLWLWLMLQALLSTTATLHHRCTRSMYRFRAVYPLTDIIRHTSYSYVFAPYPGTPCLIYLIFWIPPNSTSHLTLDWFVHSRLCCCRMPRAFFAHFTLCQIDIILHVLSKIRSTDATAQVVFFSMNMICSFSFSLIPASIGTT